MVNVCLTKFTGIAINKNGIIFFADGANIRKIDESGVIWTLIGSQGPPQHWTPFPCWNTVNITKVSCTQIALLIASICHLDG